MLEIAEPVGDLLELNRAEHMLISALRKMAAGQGDCPLIVREFTSQCGAGADDLLGSFGAFLNAIGHASRHRLQIGFPGYLDLTGDERQLLTLIAAGQGADRASLQSHLRWLVRGEHRATITIAIETLCLLLAQHDLNLSDGWFAQSAPQQSPHALRAIA